MRLFFSKDESFLKYLCASKNLLKIKIVSWEGEDN
jgi:hypothetical protein